MGSRVKPTRIMCVNCNICVNTLRRYPALALDSSVTSLICSWVHPQIILEDDYVCEACRDLAMAAVNNLHRKVSGSEEAGPSTKGHANVCLICGCSTATRQSDRVLRKNPSKMQQSIINIIASKIAPRELSVSGRVCHACWLRMKREVVRMNQQNVKKPQLDTSDDVQQDPRLSQPSQAVAEPESMLTETQSIVLPNYRCAANSTHTCVFPNCTSTSLHNISDKLRAKV